ncbi:MAG: VOC family protein [Caulobacteraceae bacterium]|nr:VOC family protein [Caulobacteraceae bacterium]
MTDPTGTRPLVSHVSVGVADIDRAGVFYDAVMAVLGARRVMAHPGGIGYGRAFPEFWASKPHDGGAAHAGNGTHVCFTADSIDAIQAFHAAGLAHGGTDDGASGLRPEYAPNYYAAFLLDPDGNKVEALCWVKTGA